MSLVVSSRSIVRCLRFEPFPSLTRHRHLTRARAASLPWGSGSIANRRFVNKSAIRSGTAAVNLFCQNRHYLRRFTMPPSNPTTPSAATMPDAATATESIRDAEDEGLKVADDIVVGGDSGNADNSKGSASGGGGGGGAVPEQPTDMRTEADLLLAFAEVPTLARAVVREAPYGGVIITATQQQRNLVGNSQRRYNVTAAVPRVALMEAAEGEGPLAAMVGAPQEIGADVLMSSVSPSGAKQVVFLKGPTDATSVLLQLWQGARLQWELAVPKALHGPLVNDGYFASGAAWGADESTLVYTAETPAPERTPAWGAPSSLSSEAGAAKSEGAAPRTWRGVGAAVEDWGELNTGKRPPAPYVLDLTRQEVLKVTGLPEEHSVGLPRWCPSQSTTSIPTPTSTTPTSCSPAVGESRGLVLVAWPHAAPPSFPRLAAAGAPRKLGVVFCYNRCAHMYRVDVRREPDGKLQFGEAAVRLAPSLDSCLSPVFSPGGEALLFISHEEAVAKGTHGGTARLYRLDWSTETCAPTSPEPHLVVDLVDRPAGPTAFPGLYTAAIPEEGFVGPTTLLLNTQWGAAAAIVAVDTRPSSTTPAVPTPLTPIDAPSGGDSTAPGGGEGGGLASWTVLGVAGRLLVASRAAPDSPTQLYVAQLPDDPTTLTGLQGPGLLRWRPLELSPGAQYDLPGAVLTALEDLEFQVMRVTPRVGDCSAPFESLVWMPRKRTGPLPAVICPHGGPHTAVNAGWYPSYAFLTALGYVVLSPNYRGSTGYGQAALCSLPGAIGRHDVDDCMVALAAAVDSGLVDPSRVSVVGGSHGGFLTAHLLGQHPGAFRAGVMRNPVTNISGMVEASDIPDWGFVEVMGSEEGRRRCSPVPTPADLAAMYDASPVVHVDAVRAPVFMMLGARDRRVPPPDGLQYLTALRGRDVASVGPPPPTRLIVFPEDAHGLDKPQTEYEQWLNVAWWLKTYAGPAG